MSARVEQVRTPSHWRPGPRTTPDLVGSQEIPGEWWVAGWVARREDRWLHSLPQFQSLEKWESGPTWGPTPRELQVQIGISGHQSDIWALLTVLLAVLQGPTVLARVSTASVKTWLPTSPGETAACLQTQTTFT